MPIPNKEQRKELVIQTKIDYFNLFDCNLSDLKEVSIYFEKATYEKDEFIFMDVKILNELLDASNLKKFDGDHNNILSSFLNRIYVPRFFYYLHYFFEIENNPNIKNVVNLMFKAKEMHLPIGGSNISFNHFLRLIIEDSSLFLDYIMILKMFNLLDFPNQINDVEHLNQIMLDELFKLEYLNE